MAITKVEEAASKAEYPLFIPFIMAADPDSQTTIDIALQLQEAGAHILELGIPYSDPLADGPLLQRSAKRALEQGMSLEKAMMLVPEMRKRGLTIPVIIFTYYNPVMRMGQESFLDKVKEQGADGVLIPDLPFEESRELNNAAQTRGLANISLVAPTSSSRIKKIAESAEGFLYCVSSLGVTGTRDSFPPEAYTFIENVKENSRVPVAVGFGISKQEQVERLRGVCDGVIVGSAIMKTVEDNISRLSDQETRQNALNDIKSFVSSLISS
ncbi:tryptophan synthase subunit alpha [Salibacterium salarium]|uniref:Tryptophan synthase alpha chain n=1 Tax=Salibacterium salarium TaxID=284579 RepID=A0A428N4N8_9BACI|nr:tryptophan synthase subunit alpha [Salibacterium salarium]RSL33454.1 tryptophan synthase subunit alpha [Salibacterium salarium]